MNIAKFAWIAPIVCALAACDSNESASTEPSVSALVTRQSPAPVTFPKTDGPDVNPRKGWNAGWNNDLPNTSVGFQYIEWKAFEPTKGDFKWDVIEAVMDRPGTRGRHVVLRLHCDWDTKLKTNCPNWIYTQVGVARIKGITTGDIPTDAYITDYNDPKYIAEATRAIAALAAHYRGDPRIQAFQLGMLGVWGEWHAGNFRFPNGNRYVISDASGKAIIGAYKANVTYAPIQGRYPWEEPLKSAGGMGFHNDFFVANNGHSDEFDNTLSATGAWLNGPIGGEVPPRRDATMLAAEINAMYGTPKGESMIRTGHYSNMAPGAYYQSPSDPNYASYMRLHRMMGYNFQIDSAVFPTIQERAGTLYSQVIGTNIGIAPTYHAWTTQFALLDSDNNPVRRDYVTQNFRNVRPQGTFVLRSNMSLRMLPAGTYKLAVRVVQPGAEKAKTNAWKLLPRNTYILFANQMQTVPGVWGSDNALVGGWSVLGNVSVR
jgi:Domain of unknown function (DUF4832)/Beta-galactosidase